MACYYDYRWKRIPNLLVIVIGVIGTVRSFVGWDIGGCLFYIGTAIAVIGLFYIFFQIGALGAGDVKLFGVCGGFFPSDKIIYFLFFSLFFAAIISILKICIYKQRKIGVCMAGPVLAGVLLYLGGVY